MVHHIARGGERRRVGDRLGDRRRGGASGGSKQTDAHSLLTALLVACAYALGSIPSGLLVGRRFGIDVRAAGSGNIGAANVARVVGWGAGFATLLADALKGALPVCLARFLGLGGTAECAAGVAAVAGHLFPAFARFRGGKGVATSFGVVLVLAPEVALTCAAVFAAVAMATRIASVASLAAAIALPVALYLAGRPFAVGVTGLVLALAVTLRHRDNIRRLWGGQEPRF